MRGSSAPENSNSPLDWTSLARYRPILEVDPAGAGCQNFLGVLSFLLKRAPSSQEGLGRFRLAKPEMQFNPADAVLTGVRLIDLPVPAGRNASLRKRQYNMWKLERRPAEEAPRSGTQHPIPTPLHETCLETLLFCALMAT